jgi:hypothetical protein
VPIFHEVHASNDLIVIQAQHEKSIKQLVINEQDTTQIKNKKYCYELIIDSTKIDIVRITDEVAIYLYDYHVENINKKALHLNTGLLDNFNLINYIYHIYGHKSYHLVEAIKYALIKEFYKLYHENLSQSFFNSKLYHSMMLKLLKNYYESTYYNEIDYFNESEFYFAIRLIGHGIKTHRLKMFKSLTYDVAKTIFYQHIDKENI